MTMAVKEVRRRLKAIAKVTTDEIYKVPPPERKPVRDYFTNRLKEEVEDRELQEEIQRMLDDGCPNAND